jgi:phosphate-selective porin OprO/OprP
MLSRHAAILIACEVIAILLREPAAAQSTPQSSNTRIQAIEGQINALQDELQNLKSDLSNTNSELRKSQNETKKAQDEAHKAKSQADAAAASTPLITFPHGRPTFSNADQSASLSLGLQVQFDTGGYFQDNHGADVQPPGARELNAGSTVRRAKIFVVGRFGDWGVNLTPEFGGAPDGTVSLYEANLNYTGFKPVTATVGYFRPWYSLQDSQSTNDFLLMERPSIVEIARGLAGGDARASLGLKASTNDYFASAYLTGGTWGDQNGGLLNREQLGGVLRVAARPFHGEDWNTHVGFSGSAVFAPAKSNSHQPGETIESIRLRDRPELRIDTNRLIDTGDIDTDKAGTLDFELGGNWHNFLLQGEYIRIDVDRNQDSAVHFDGGYVEGSWVITGESRKYDPSVAAWKRPVPAHPFNPASGEDGWGAWELAARYSMTDLDSRDVDGGRQQVFGLALSWYPTELVRFVMQGDYVDVDRNVDGTEVGQNFWNLALRCQFAL